MQEWQRTESLRNNVILDQMIVMPNHLHGIIAIIESKGVLQYAPTKWISPSQTIGAIIRDFKAATASKINKLRKSPGQKVWQRN
jgi:putative transposase